MIPLLFSAMFYAPIISMRRAILVLLSAITLGCNSVPSRDTLDREGNSKSYITAVDDGFFRVVVTTAATTKIAGIDGVRVNWGRFNTGSGFVSAGERKILVRLWGENKKMGLPVGSPVGKVETYGCITFEAQSGRSYEVSSAIGDSVYLVEVTDVTEGSQNKRLIHTSPVAFSDAATLETCRPLVNRTSIQRNN